MSEPMIRNAFTYGAGDGEPSAALWMQIQTAIAARRQRRLWWRRLAVAAAAVLMLAGGGVAAVPDARAAVLDTVKSWVTVWHGKVGQAEAELKWMDPAQAQTEIAKQNIPYTPPKRFGSVAEAAAALGFQPAQPHLPESSVLTVQGQQISVGDGLEFREITIQYLLGDNPYRVITGADFRYETGTWVPQAHERLDGALIGAQPPAALRKVDLGATEALCFEYPEANPKTVCSMLLGGRGITVEGVNPETVIELAKSLVR